MGSIFELIADTALEVMDDYYTECHVCEATDVDLYCYNGQQYDAEGNQLDSSYDTYAVCAGCIQAGRVGHIGDFEYISTVESYLAGRPLTENERAHLREQLMVKYRHTPDIPVFMQYDDRPLCCNDIAEFTGHPQNDDELNLMAETCSYWEKGPVSPDEWPDFRQDGPPESYHDVAGFCCRHCGQKYFTFQFT